MRDYLLLDPLRRPDGQSVKTLRLGWALTAALSTFTETSAPAEQAEAAQQVADLLSERAASWGRSDYSTQQARRDQERAATWRGIAAQRRRVAAARAAVTSSVQTLGGPDWGADPPRERCGRDWCDGRMHYEQDPDEVRRPDAVPCPRRVR